MLNVRILNSYCSPLRLRLIFLNYILPTCACRLYCIAFGLTSQHLQINKEIEQRHHKRVFERNEITKQITQSPLCVSKAFKEPLHYRQN